MADVRLYLFDFIKMSGGKYRMPTLLLSVTKGGKIVRELSMKQILALDTAIPMFGKNGETWGTPSLFLGIANHTSAAEAPTSTRA
jgi:hypothetical protein